jgi:hypothetical protein
MSTTKIDRQQVYEKYNGHCAYCGVKIDIKQMQVDHIIPKETFHHPKYNPGYYNANDPRNLNPSCRSCNNYKSSLPMEEFRRYVGQQIEILRRDRPTFRMAERFGLIQCLPQKVVFHFEKIENNGQNNPTP